MRIEGVQRVRQTLEKLKGKYGKSNPSVVVGYTANYALSVHENLEARHKEGKQARYLTEPLERLKNELAELLKQE